MTHVLTKQGAVVVFAVSGIGVKITVIDGTRMWSVTADHPVARNIYREYLEDGWVPVR